MMQEVTGHPQAKNESQFKLHTLYAKISLKWIMELNVNDRTITSKKTEENLQDLRIGKAFLDLILKTQSIKEKIN